MNWRNIFIGLIAAVLLTLILPLLVQSAQWADGEVEMSAVDRWLEINNYIAFGSSPGLTSGYVPYATGANSLANGFPFNNATQTGTLDVIGDVTGTSSNATYADLAADTDLVNGYTGVRTATYVIAASDAPAHVKAQADYVCDGGVGNSDAASINALCGENVTIELSEGTFTFYNNSILLYSGMCLRGQGKSTKIIGSFGGGLQDASVIAIKNSDTATGYDAASGITIENILIDSPLSNGIGIAHAKDIIIRNVWGEDCYWHYIDAGGCFNVIVDGLISETDLTYASLQIDNLTLIHAIDILIDGVVTSVNIDNTISDTFFISNISVKGTSTTTAGAIHLRRSGGKNIFIDKANVYGGAYGVYSDDNTSWTNIHITNSIFEAQSWRAIFIQNPSSGTNTDVFISDVDIKLADFQGMAFDGIENLQIHHVNIDGTWGNATPANTKGISYGTCSKVNITDLIIDGATNMPYYGVTSTSSSGVTISDSHFENTRTAILLTSNTNVLITNNEFSNILTAKVASSGTAPTGIISGNQGYIAPGEIRTYSGTIATLTQNAYNSLDNPFGQSVGVLNLQIYVSTNATATSPNIDCGIGSSATTDYTTLFDDLPGETIGFYLSTVATPGTQTVPILWASGSGNRYLNMSIKDAAATGMVATYTVTVMGL